MLIHGLFLLPGSALFLSSIAKFIGAKKIVIEFEQFKLSRYRYFAASIEMLAAIMLAAPQTRLLGALLGSSYLGACFIPNVQYLGFKAAIPAMVLSILIWIGTILTYAGMS